MAVVLTLNSIVSRTKEQVSCEVGSEAAVLNLANGAYYGLDEVGARIWTLLAEPQTVGQLRDAMLTEYQVEAARGERDLWQFLSELAAEHLIEVREEPGAGGAPEEAAEAGHPGSDP